MVMCCQSNSNFLIFAVLIVWCRPCRRYRLFYAGSFVFTFTDCYKLEICL